MAVTSKDDRRRPWGKFYWSDWRANKELRMCGFAARGLWMDLLSIMAEAEPYGHLLINGKPPTAKQLGGLLGGGEREVAALLKEMDENGVHGRTEEGVIFSRRMVRDRAKEDADRTNGAGGGNPKLKNRPEGVNPQANPPVGKGDKAQMLDARSQKPEGKEEGRDAPPPPRGTRLPSDWSPSEADREFAASLGVSPPAFARISEQFRDYWISKAGAGGTKLDWSATWRIWVRREVDDGNGNNSGQHGRPARTGGTQRDIQLAAALSSCRD